MGSFPLRYLAPLASIAVQRRFIVSGTTDQYLLPSDLLEDAANAVRSVQNGGPSFTIDAERRSAVLSFGRVLDEHVDNIPQDCDNGYLVERDPHWHAIRCAAAKCLEAIGFTPEEIEKAAFD